MAMDSKPRYMDLHAGTDEEVSVVNTFLHVGPRKQIDLIGTYKSAPIPSMALDEEQTSFGDDESEDGDVDGVTHLQAYDSFGGVQDTANLLKDSCSSTAAKSSDGYRVSVVNTFVHVDDAKGIEEDEDILTKPLTAPAGYLAKLIPLDNPGANDDDEIARYQTYDSFSNSASNFPDIMRSASTGSALAVAGSCVLEQPDEDDDTGLDRYQTYDHFNSLNLDDSADGMVRPDAGLQAKAQQKQPLDLCSLIGGRAEPSQASRSGMLAPGAAQQPVAMMMPMMNVPVVSAALAAGGLKVLPSSPAPSSHQSSPQQSPRPVEAASAGSKDATALILEKTAAGFPRVRWNVDGSKLWSKYKQIMSPEFQLDVPGAGLHPFKLMVLAKETKKKGGHSFQSSKGKSELFLKCEASLPDTVEKFKCRVTVSCDTTGVEFCRGPISHQFLERHCCALQPSDDDWDLLQVVDKVGKRFELCLEVLDSKS